MVSMPMVEGPSCLIVSSPFTTLKSTFPKVVSNTLALKRLARRRSARRRSALKRLALLRSASLRSASLRSAPLRLAPLRSAPPRSAPPRPAPLRWALLRWALLRSALLRFGRCTSGCPTLHLFHVSTPCLRISSCSWFAIALCPLSSPFTTWGSVNRCSQRWCDTSICRFHQPIFLYHFPGEFLHQFHRLHAHRHYATNQPHN